MAQAPADFLWVWHFSQSDTLRRKGESGKSGDGQLSEVSLIVFTELQPFWKLLWKYPIWPT
jgi:hypothetical protein